MSYQLLSINQLGAVYEALLSYRGFFATEDLYEVMPERKQVRAADDEEEEEVAEAEGSSSQLPSREQWWMDIGAILNGSG